MRDHGAYQLRRLQEDVNAPFSGTNLPTTPSTAPRGPGTPVHWPGVHACYAVPLSGRSCCAAVEPGGRRLVKTTGAAVG